MSESGFDFIVILEKIEMQEDTRRAIRGILESLSAIDPYFELRKDIGTAEVVKYNLRKLDKLLSMLSGSEDFMKVVFAVRRGIGEYDKIMSTVITKGIGTMEAYTVGEIEREGGTKTKPSKTYLDVKASFGDILGILKIVLERPESSKFFREELEKMETGAEGRPQLPFRLFFGSMTPAD